ncbi:MAG: hypothetical protein HYZ16_09795 [Bacteroidetes bacterium]|jgi:hypothetical protein|nr:hypothetical protein [Bacteroidota bacterium]
MPRKEKLSINEQDIPKDLACLGISCAVDFYRMAYFFEKAIGGTVTLMPTNLIEGHSHVDMYVAQYDKASIYLLKNQTPDGMFLPRVHMADFLLIFPETHTHFVVETVKQRLLELGSVQGIFAVDKRFIPPKKLKHFV